jgi:hypothetical protein
VASFASVFLYEYYSQEFLLGYTREKSVVPSVVGRGREQVQHSMEAQDRELFAEEERQEGEIECECFGI